MIVVAFECHTAAGREQKKARAKMTISFNAELHVPSIDFQWCRFACFLIVVRVEQWGTDGNESTFTFPRFCYDLPAQSCDSLSNFLLYRSEEHNCIFDLLLWLSLMVLCNFYTIYKFFSFWLNNFFTEMLPETLNTQCVYIILFDRQFNQLQEKLFLTVFGIVHLA